MMDSRCLRGRLSAMQLLLTSGGSMWPLPLVSLGITALLGGALAACRPQAASQPEARPAVVATTSLLCDLTRQIAGETVKLTCLIQPGQDPHTYVPTPGDRQAIDQARLVLYGGYGFDDSLSGLVRATQGRVPAVAVSELAVPKPLMGEEHHHHGEETSAEAAHAEAAESEPPTASSYAVSSPTTAESAAPMAEAEQQAPDPHVWNDARNGAALVQVIGRELARINPAEKSGYASKAEQLSGQITAIDRWIRQQIATIPSQNRKLISTHDALSYYGNAYGIEVAGALQGLSTQNQPSPQRLATLVEEVRSAQVPTIFVENTTNPKLMETVAREAGVKVSTQPLYVEGPGGPKTTATNYQQMLVENTCTLVEGLGGQCDRAQAPLR
jgi:manganese/iron transport system substrate-binding protein